MRGGRDLWHGPIQPARTGLEQPISQAMLRIRGNRDTLLSALIAHWSEQQIGLPPRNAKPQQRPRGNSSQHT